MYLIIMYILDFLNSCTFLQEKKPKSVLSTTFSAPKKEVKEKKSGQSAGVKAFLERQEREAKEKGGE